MSDNDRLIVAAFEELDQEQFCSLHTIAFSELFTQNKVIANHFNPAVFNWKYNAPAGKAKIATITREGRIVAAVSMFPLDVKMGAHMHKVWHSGDVAVLPEYQGKFFFNQCMTALKNTIEKDVFLFGFPNHNNLTGAKRAGFQSVRELSFYVKPYFFFATGKQIAPVGEFDASQDIYANELATAAGTMVHRSKDYMNWRYVQKPSCNYFFYSHKESGRVTGNVVVRTTVVKGVRALLIMEYHFIDKSAIPFLHQFINQQAKKNKCMLIVMITSSTPSFTRRFIKVPVRFEPKKLVLFGNGQGNANHPLLTTDWFVQSGDWDAF